MYLKSILHLFLFLYIILKELSFWFSTKEQYFFKKEWTWCERIDLHMVLIQPTCLFGIRTYVHYINYRCLFASEYDINRTSMLCALYGHREWVSSLSVGQPIILVLLLMCKNVCVSRRCRGEISPDLTTEETGRISLVPRVSRSYLLWELQCDIGCNSVLDTLDYSW